MNYKDCNANFRIGDVVFAEHLYTRKTFNRFKNDVGEEVRDAVPFDHNKKMIIVGIRNVIMTNSDLNYPPYDPEGDNTKYRTGKSEWMLLVTEDWKREPVLARPEDCEVIGYA